MRLAQSPGVQRDHLPMAARQPAQAALIDASVESGPLQTHDDDLRQDFAYTVILLTVEAA